MRRLYVISIVLYGDRVITLKENEFSYIPLGKKYRLFNSSTDNLEIIEVHSRAYLCEDHIFRIDNGCGRN